MLETHDLMKDPSQVHKILHSNLSNIAVKKTFIIANPQWNYVKYRF